MLFEWTLCKVSNYWVKFEINIFPRTQSHRALLEETTKSKENVVTGNKVDVDKIIFGGVIFHPGEMTFSYFSTVLPDVYGVR